MNLALGQLKVLGTKKKIQFEHFPLLVTKVSFSNKGGSRLRARPFKIDFGQLEIEFHPKYLV